MKEIIILGDVEMGGGTLTDDFVSDKALAKLILELAQRKHAVDIVFNGDTFDFLKCPIITKTFKKGTFKQKRQYPRHITKEVSLTKLKLVHKAHKKVFNALSKYLQKENKHIYFVLGNHDHDLMYQELQDKIKNILGKPLQVHFPGLTYKYKQVYAEHGHQYDFLNQIDPEHWYLTYRNKKVLNIPWVSFSVVSRFLEMKEKHPFMERIFPRTTIYSNHKTLSRKLSFGYVSCVAKSCIYYPLRYHFDPTYIYPKELLREFYRRFKNVHWEVDNVMNKFMNKRRNMKRDFKVHVLGHIHFPFYEEKADEVYIHPGSWRDEYDFDSKTRKLIARDKRYVKVLTDGDDLSYELVTLPNNREPLDFDTVRMDEHSSIVKVKEEVDKLN